MHPFCDELTTGDQRDVKINDIVVNRISGILYKWVNYGKGWRTRWFVLQDGVLSYYRIHVPNKIIVTKETEKGAKLIGDESFRRLTRHRNSGHHPHRKPVGEVHLKVSTIRESRSDDIRFSIFTGTKRLHLRAENRDDRVAWMEALQAVKDLFPRMSNCELMASVCDITVSTEKVRRRLLEEGVSEAAIHDNENIMRSEFSALQDQLVVLKQKHLLLIDTLRMLEDYSRRLGIQNNYTPNYNNPVITFDIIHDISPKVHIEMLNRLFFMENTPTESTIELSSFFVIVVRSKLTL